MEERKDGSRNYPFNAKRAGPGGTGRILAGKPRAYTTPFREINKKRKKGKTLGLKLLASFADSPQRKKKLRLFLPHATLGRFQPRSNTLSRSGTSTGHTKGCLVPTLRAGDLGPSRFQPRRKGRSPITEGLSWVNCEEVWPFRC